MDSCMFNTVGNLRLDGFLWRIEATFLRGSGSEQWAGRGTMK